MGVAANTRGAAPCARARALARRSVARRARPRVRFWPCACKGHLWLASDKKWTSERPQFRSTVWSSRYEARNVLDSDLRSPWHTGHSCAEYPKSNRDQWVAFDFGLEGANLSGVRVTAPSKKEWDGAEMKSFRIEKADELEGPWESVFQGVGKKTKSPQPSSASPASTLAYLRLFVIDNHGHDCITVGNVEFRGELLSDGTRSSPRRRLADTPRGAAHKGRQGPGRRGARRP